MSVGTTAAIVGLGVAAGTSIVGGVMKSKAANSAAQIQSNAADQAGQKVTDAAASVNPNILAAANDAGGNVKDAARVAGENVNLSALTAKDQAQAAAVSSNSLLDPYGQAGDKAAGVLSAGIAPGGDFDKTPTLADLQIDPGYQFRLDQGEEALTRSAAANGAVGGGGFQKDLNNYVQGSASQEYQNAFNRFETSTQNRFNNVNTVATEGAAARAKQGANLIDSAQYGGNITTDASKYAGTANTDASKVAGQEEIDATNLTSANTVGAAKTAADYLTQGANAQAAGKVASTNSIWDGIGGGANDALSTVLSNPARNYFKRQTANGNTIH